MDEQLTYTAVKPREERIPDVVDFARDCMGFYPDSRQEELLRGTERRVVVKAARMWGKSTIAVVKVLHAAWQRPNDKVLMVCATQAECTRMKEWLALERNRLGIAGRVEVVTGRGMKFRRVDVAVIDDAARVKDEIYDALRPAVAAARGELWLLSTPGKQEGFFFEAWKRGKWTKVQAGANDTPHMAAEFLAEEEAELGAVRYSSEYLCEFEGEVEVEYVLEYLDEKGEVWARYGSNIDWSLGRDGPWKGYAEDKEK